MNPFVNPKKRSVSLPAGCKNLVDVLHPPEEDEAAIGRLIHFVAQQKGTTELVIGPADREGTPVKYKVDGIWHEEPPLPSRTRPSAELTRLAKLRDGRFPKEGIVSIAFAGARAVWKFQIESELGKCVFTRIEE